MANGTEQKRKQHRFGGVPHEQPGTPDPTLIQLLASNAVLVEEHMPLALHLALPFILIFPWVMGLSLALVR
jgi:hypothetical protein